MDPVLTARVRRLWPIAAVLVIGATFSVLHTLVFTPLSDRYHRVLASAGAIGASIDPSRAEPALPPRVAAALASNSLPASEADQRAGSGSLGATLLQRLAQSATSHSLDVELSEPGLTTQTASGVEVRTHLKLHGHYADFVAFVDELGHDGGLYRLERMALLPAQGGTHEIEVWIARYWIKRGEGGS